MRTSITMLCEETAWEEWVPLEKSWRALTTPAVPGLYRIQLIEGENSQLAYIGQSYNLKERMGALKHVYGDAIPLDTPHFAGPELWTWLHRHPQSHLEVSFASFPTIPKVLRKGLECLAIGLYHQQAGHSPLINFGRTYDEWTMLRYLTDEHKALELDPPGPLTGNPHNERWCGLNWGAWVPVQHAQFVAGGAGLYRLRVPDCDSLIYIGQGKLRERLKAHRKHSYLECSWIAGSWSYHRRLELVSDCVGAHVLETATIPLWQFQHDVPSGGPEGLRVAA